MSKVSLEVKPYLAPMPVLMIATYNEDGTVDVMISERGMMDMNLLLGEVLEIPKVTGPDGNPLRIRICGLKRTSKKRAAR